MHPARKYKMKIAEIYQSIQGEGKLAGTLSVFIRTTGCNLRCAWCDTPYTSWSPEGEWIEIDEILARVESYPANHVVITGGEPFIARDIEVLTYALKTRDYHITIETAGTVWKNVACDLASISPKLANSTPWRRDPRWAKRHEAARINLDVILGLMEADDYQLKFVVDKPEDMTEIEALLDQLDARLVASRQKETSDDASETTVASAPPQTVNDKSSGLRRAHIPSSNVLLMPQGVTREELEGKTRWVAELCARYGYRYCPRLHIELFGNTRGT